MDKPTTTHLFDRECPEHVDVRRANVCTCPACWNLESDRTHLQTDGRTGWSAGLRSIYIVQFTDEEGYYLSAIKEGYLTLEAATEAAQALGVEVGFDLGVPAL